MTAEYGTNDSIGGDLNLTQTAAGMALARPPPVEEMIQVPPVQPIWLQLVTCQ